MMIRRNPPPGSEPPPSNIQKLILSSCEAQVALSLTVTCLDISSSVTTLTSLLLLDETQEQNSRALEKPDGDAKKARFGGLLKDKGFSGEALKRPLTGLFRKTGKGPSNKKKDEEETAEPSIAAPPTNFPNMASISATLESVQLDEEYQFRERNPETGSKTTLNGNAVYGITTMHPLQRYFKVDDIDISILSRALPTEMRKDEDVPWTAQSLFNSLEARIKKEKLEAREQRNGSPSTGVARRMF